MSVELFQKQGSNEHMHKLRMVHLPINQKKREQWFGPFRANHEWKGNIEIERERATTKKNIRNESISPHKRQLSSWLLTISFNLHFSTESPSFWVGQTFVPFHSFSFQHKSAFNSPIFYTKKHKPANYDIHISTNSLHTHRKLNPFEIHDFFLLCVIAQCLWLKNFYFSFSFRCDFFSSKKCFYLEMVRVLSLSFI